MANKKYLLAAFLLLLNACNPIDPFQVAEGTTHKYQWTSADLKVKSSKKIAVAVRDRRTYVLIREKLPNFVGLVRQGYGVPFDAKTESGNALATDFGQSIVDGLKAKGNSAAALTIAPSLDKAAAKRDLLQMQAERFMLITLNEWKSNTFWRTELHFDVDLNIYDQSGTELESKSLKGTDVEEGEGFTPKSRSQQVSAMIFQKKLEDLLNDPAVVSALQ